MKRKDECSASTEAAVDAPSGTAVAVSVPKKAPEWATRIVPLDELWESGAARLTEITADPTVMRWIGDTKPWDPSKVAELVRWAREDKGRSASERAFWSWAIVETPNSRTTDGADDRGDVVGFVGLRPTKDPMFPGLQLRFFVDGGHQRRGHGKRAVRSAVDEYNRELINQPPQTGHYAASQPRRRTQRPSAVWAFVRQDNAASCGMLESMGFGRAGTKRFGAEEELAFKKPLATALAQPKKSTM